MLEGSRQGPGNQREVVLSIIEGEIALGGLVEPIQGNSGRSEIDLAA